MTEEFNVVVIGGGPGGYVAAIRAAQLGGKVALIERDRLGGICNNYGCIPSKTMIKLAEIQSNIPLARQFGIRMTSEGVDQKQMMESRNMLLNKLMKGVETLLKSNGVKIFSGVGRIKSRHEVSVYKGDKFEETLKCKNIIIATGSTGTKPKIFSGSKNIFTSEEFLSTAEIPKDILIVGGGPEGVEFACIFSQFGADVTIVEMLDRLLSFEDRDISSRVEKILKDKGVKILTNAKVAEISDEGKVRVKLSNGKTIESSKVLVSTGRRPNTQNIGLETVGVKTDEFGKVMVNDKMETSVKGVYAVGDVAGGRVAHEAIENGIVAAENTMGFNSSMKGRLVPYCIYAIPEIARIGMTEDDARKKHDVKVGKFYFKASGRAMTLGDSYGLVKVIIDKKTKKFLGVHMINERASDMIGEAILALKYLKADDVINTLHPHPTLVEAFREAVMDAYGMAIHSLNQKEKKVSKSLKHFVKE
ncbi:MAG: dihydrolipoyl dehydrogenase [Candidatus Aenigmarchaeota archaeon]|nr:dihydrolipoyl dehydrogenase [Candidatus Aenigmarchaeota archaeon]